MPARLLPFLVLLGGCGLLRAPAPDVEARLAARAARYAEAPDPATRQALVARDFALAGLAPVADPAIGGVNRPGEGGPFVRRATVVGIVPGRWPGLRDTLVVVAGPADAATAAAVVEAAARLAARARAGAAPDRSVAWALWDPGLTPAQGADRVRASLLWPAGRIDTVHTVGTGPSARLEGAAAVARLAATAEQLAARPPR